MVRNSKRTALKRAAATVGYRVRRRVPGIRVLIYHWIGGNSGLQLDIPLPAFTEQLRSAGQHLSLGDALRACGTGTDPEISGTVLTFDDGFADTFANCLTLFSDEGIPATFYLTTGDIVRGWIWTSAGVAKAVSPQLLREAAANPLFNFGSHSHSHRPLVGLSGAEIHEELTRSRSLIEDWVGRSVDDFAYPKGLWNERTNEIVRLHFRSAAISGSRPVGPGTDPYRLRRYPIQASDDPMLFRAKLDGAMFLEDSARSARDRLLRLTGRQPRR